MFREQSLYAFLIIGIIILIMSCDRKRPNNQVEEPATQNGRDTLMVTSQSTEPTRFRFYLENSASMDGYIKGNTHFEAALTTLLVKLKYNYGAEKIKLNFVNSKIYPSEIDEVELFAKALDPSSIDYKKGDRSSSDLNNIIRDLLEATPDDEVCIFVSDCIYSIGTGDTESLLSYQQSLTMDAYLTRLSFVDLSTLILRLTSDFNGTYYDKNDAKTVLSGDETRPYYIWVIAKHALMRDVLGKISFEDLKGLESQLYFSGGALNNLDPNFSILLDTDVIGRFSPLRSARKSNVVQGLENIKKDTRNPDVDLGFKVVLDLSDLAINNNYLLDCSNYRVNNGFDIQSIEAYDASKLSNSDANRLNSESFTHIITLQAKDLKQVKNGNVKISLRPRFDLWTSGYSTTDDTIIGNNLDKTFGLSYLINGVIEAYEEVLDGESFQFMKLEIPIAR